MYGHCHHGSGSESDGESMLGKQVSLDQQVLVMLDGGFHGSTACRSQEDNLKEAGGVGQRPSQGQLNHR